MISAGQPKRAFYRKYKDPDRLHNDTASCRNIQYSIIWTPRAPLKNKCIEQLKIRSSICIRDVTQGIEYECAETQRNTTKEIRIKRKIATVKADYHTWK